MDKSVFQMDPPDVALERRFKFVTNEKTRIKATFDRIRAQLAQEAKRKSRKKVDRRATKGRKIK